VPAPAATAPDQKPAVNAPKAEPAAKPVTRAEEPVSQLSPPLADDKRAAKYDVAAEPQREPKSAGIPKIDSMKAK
jgi:hypothetical protein